MSQFKEGDFVRHKLDKDNLLEVVRVDDWWLDPQLIVRDASGEYDPSHTFKVSADMVSPAPRGLLGQL